jgi:hypothetical protein
MPDNVAEMTTITAGTEIATVGTITTRGLVSVEVGVQAVVDREA